MTSRYAVASIHGRFQPVHLSHVDYMLAAFDRSDFVYIGLTQYRLRDLADVPGSGNHRASPASNPLTYFERCAMIRAVMQEYEIAHERFEILPFPLESPRELIDFLPTEVPVLTTRVDEWNDHKVELLSRLGYAVHVMYEVDPPARSATLIRDLILGQDPSWEEQVPTSVIRYLRTLELRERLVDGA